MLADARRRASVGQFRWVAASIAAESRVQVEPRAARLLCLAHLSRPRAFVERSGWRRYRIHGCGVCGATRGLVEVPGPVVAVLDDRLTGDLDPTPEGGLRVNWLAAKVAGDFDHVEVGRVKAQDVEEFVMQAGNSTGRRRREPTWSAQPGGELTEESVRQLRSLTRFARPGR